MKIGIMILIFVLLFIQVFAQIQCLFDDETKTLKIEGNGILKRDDFIQCEADFNIENEPKKVIIEERITSIGKATFSYSLIESIEIGKDVERIEERVFENCQTLESVIFNSNSNLTIIDDYAFKNCIISRNF